MLIPLKRRRIFGGYRVVVSSLNLAYLRVLYKDWVGGRWTGYECELARIILPVSEPYILLYTQSKWPFDTGSILRNTENFVKLNDGQKRAKVSEILKKGVAEDEAVVAGCVIEYTHKQEIFGFSLCYLDFPLTPINDVLVACERNSRLLLQCRKDFTESLHRNLTLHHNGAESFMYTNVLCGFSKTALSVFGWRIVLSPAGLTLVDDSGQTIGWFESYYGNQGKVSHYPGYQPFVQRWIMKKTALSSAGEKCAENVSIKMATDVYISEVPS